MKNRWICGSGWILVEIAIGSWSLIGGGRFQWEIKTGIDLQRFRSGWIQLENYVLLDLAGDLDPHVDLNNELDPGSDLGESKICVLG